MASTTLTEPLPWINSILLAGDQDRSRWDRGLIAEGQAIVRQCLRGNQPGPYQVQAAINAVHTDAPTAAATDWPQILRLYDQLLAIAPNPVVALHRAVAVSEVDGPDAALTLVDRLDLDNYHLFHAIRADLLRRLGRNAEGARRTTRRSPAPATPPSATSCSTTVRRSPRSDAVRRSTVTLPASSLEATTRGGSEVLRSGQLT